LQFDSNPSPRAVPQPAPRDRAFGYGGRMSTSLAEAVERIGDRWSLLVVDALLAAPLRFNDLQEAVPGIAPNILSRRLKHLETEGVLLASRYSQRPPRSVYELTAAGRELAGALRLLSQWGARHTAPDAGEPLRHEACGTPAEARWYCPTCARALEDDEATALHRL
jgi:DNA-binding HxlR family transcriptional regulator